MNIDLKDKKDYLSKTSFLVDNYKERFADYPDIGRACDTLIQHMALTLLRDVEWNESVIEERLDNIASVKRDDKSM